MILTRAAACLATTVMHLTLGGCGTDNNDLSPERDSVAAGLVVYAAEGGRPIDVIMAEFESRTGVGASVVSRDEAGPMSRADVYFGESFVELWEMAESDRLRPVADSLNKRLAARQLTDPERRFLPLATAPRAVVFNPDLVSGDEIRTIDDYASLANDLWKGRLCLSSSGVDGNRLLVAHLIHQNDVREAEIIVRRWLQNLAAAVHGSDAELIAAISAGECGLGILDVRLLRGTNSPAAIGLHSFPDPANWLFDVAGVGISRHASNPEAAAELLDWLLSAGGNSTYTVGWPEIGLSRESSETRDEVRLRPALEESASLAELGFLIAEADLLNQRAGYR